MGDWVRPFPSFRIREDEPNVVVKTMAYQRRNGNTIVFVLLELLPAKRNTPHGWRYIFDIFHV